MLLRSEFAQCRTMVSENIPKHKMLDEMLGWCWCILRSVVMMSTGLQRLSCVTESALYHTQEPLAKFSSLFSFHPFRFIPFPFVPSSGFSPHHFWGQRVERLLPPKMNNFYMSKFAISKLTWRAGNFKAHSSELGGQICRKERPVRQLDIASDDNDIASSWQLGLQKVLGKELHSSYHRDQHRTFSPRKKFSRYQLFTTKSNSKPKAISDHDHDHLTGQFYNGRGCCDFLSGEMSRG